MAIHSAHRLRPTHSGELRLSATFCGLLVSIRGSKPASGAVRRGQTERLRVEPARFRRVRGVASLVAILLVGGWALAHAYAAFIGERWWAAALAMDAYIQKSPNRPTTRTMSTC